MRMWLDATRRSVTTKQATAIVGDRDKACAKCFVLAILHSHAYAIWVHNVHHPYMIGGAEWSSQQNAN
jgi:hypothetical protein